MMSNEKLPEKSKLPSRKRLFVKIISFVLVGVGVVPPVVSKLNSSISSVVTGDDNKTEIIGHDKNTYNNYYSSWINGFGVLTGKNNDDSSKNESTRKDEKSKVALPVTKEPLSWSEGRLAHSISLIGTAMWAPEKSKFTRFLNLRFNIQATTNDTNNYGSVNATLYREGKDICTISLNSKTSSHYGVVYTEWTDCKDTLSGNDAVVYRARIVSSEMNLVSVGLDSVYSTRGD